MFSKTLVAYGILTLVVGGGVGYWYLHPKQEDEVHIVTRGDFVKDVSASGKVVPVQVVDLGFSQGGRIAEVYVEVGDSVRTGEVLAELENDDLAAALLQKEAALDVQRAKLRSLSEGTRDEEIAVTESDVASKETALAQASRTLIEEIQDALIVSEDAVRNKIDQFVTNSRINPELTFLVSDGSIPSRFTQSRLSIEQTLAAWQPLVLKLGTDSDVSAAIEQSFYNVTQVSDLLSLSATALSKSVVTSQSTGAAIAEYSADVAAARTAVQASYSSLTAAETNYKAAAAALETARRSLALKRAGTSAADIAGQEAQVKAAEADFAASRAVLAKTAIRAPFDGTVTAVDVKSGSSVNSNGIALRMIGGGSFEIESFVPEINIADVAVGNDAVVTLDAYGDAVPFEARVISVDPAETVRDGVSTYRVRFAFLTPDPRIRSGMTANVIITTDRRYGIISIPQGLVRRVGGESMVSVKNSGILEDRAVATGAISSLGNIEILEGLSEGDIIPIPTY